MGPAAAPKPMVHGIPAAIEERALVGFGRRTRRRYFRDFGGLRRSFVNAGSFSAGRCAQASKASQSLAGIVTTRRSRISIAAASSALRRMKSLKLVCACLHAASKSAGSSSFTRTLRTDVAMCTDLHGSWNDSIHRGHSGEEKAVGLPGWAPPRAIGGIIACRF